MFPNPGKDLNQPRFLHTIVAPIFEGARCRMRARVYSPRSYLKMSCCPKHAYGSKTVEAVLGRIVAKMQTDYRGECAKRELSSTTTRYGLSAMKQQFRMPHYMYTHWTFMLSLKNGSRLIFDPTGVQFGPAQPLVCTLERYLALPHVERQRVTYQLGAHKLGPVDEKLEECGNPLVEYFTFYSTNLLTESVLRQSAALKPEIQVRYYSQNPFSTTTSRHFDSQLPPPTSSSTGNRQRNCPLILLRTTNSTSSMGMPSSSRGQLLPRELGVRLSLRELDRSLPQTPEIVGRKNRTEGSEGSSKYWKFRCIGHRRRL
ncbi:hypothetical protein K458DRAFT_394517 [Lentithecium fluviatile CBS 122367]|uniref:Uncharacterized protein n=1 Tax=Lentithecium fluviatile CBS 122367 TaxID=1168545 RepID=A0A6G1ILK7_9PLEO|nr:hypothetical protein K458DRAFT_394517 [Lentithecium fluviatile CBS 122367]